MVPTPLNPTQQRTLATVRAARGTAAVSASFVSDLEEETAGALDRFAERIPAGQGLMVTKHALGGVHACEAQWAVPDDFAWTPARAQGQLAHRAIQLLINWRGNPAPSDVVDDAIARLCDEQRGVGEWVAGLDGGALADVRGRAVEQVTKFVEDFPRLQATWRPVTESATQWPVDGKVLLRARADLSLGQVIGDESRKVIIDLKAGRVIDRHREDLRFYALVETLRAGAAPLRVGSFYLDSSRFVPEEVTPGVLRTALRRTLDGIESMVRVRFEGQPPRRTPGGACRWCPLADECHEGNRWLSDLPERK